MRSLVRGGSLPGPLGQLAARRPTVVPSHKHFGAPDGAGLLGKTRVPSRWLPGFRTPPGPLRTGAGGLRVNTTGTRVSGPGAVRP
ncbi:hypothetical protein GZL_05487 [Streptomyces sp. 769]|nr:hypothetical protein GZL_05487 [Streptomyces sp. 769]